MISEQRLALLCPPISASNCQFHNQPHLHRLKKNRSFLHKPTYNRAAICYTARVVQAVQQRFWPDAQPLVERFGREFFRALPATPGVYLMREISGTVIYVGKAKNLKRRLGSYR